MTERHQRENNLTWTAWQDTVDARERDAGLPLTMWSQPSSRGDGTVHDGTRPRLATGDVREPCANSKDASCRNISKGSVQLSEPKLSRLSQAQLS